MSAEQVDIAIIGGGIGGITTALALQQIGLRPVIFEQADELGEVGAGLSVTPNSTHALESLGLTDYLLTEASEPMVQRLLFGETGEELNAIPRHNTRDEYGAAYYMIHRADIHAELVRRVSKTDPSAVRLNKRLETVENNGETALLTFTDGTAVEASMAIGADGLKSIVREQTFGKDEPAFTGHTAWRALIPMESVSDEYREHRSTVCVGAGKNTVYYPIRHYEILNFVAFTRADAWVEESWSHPAAPEDLLEIFDGWCDFALDPIRQIPEGACYQWGLFGREPLERWVDGPVVLLGDAAHPMLPFFGQGAACAIEDGVVLARCLDAYDDRAEALKRYEAARLPRASMLQKESNLGGERLQALNPEALKNTSIKGEDAMGIFRYNPVTAEI